MLDKVYYWLREIENVKFTGTTTIHWHEGRPIKWEKLEKGVFLKTE